MTSEEIKQSFHTLSTLLYQFELVEINLFTFYYNTQIQMCLQNVFSPLQDIKPCLKWPDQY